MKTQHAVFAIVLLLSSLLPAGMTHADDSFHPSRARLLIHGHQDVSKTTTIKSKLIPAGNLVNGIAPMFFLGVDHKLVEWLNVQSFAKWHSVENDPGVTLCLSPKFGKFWAWVDAEITYPDKGGYMFAQAQFKALDWLHTGFESEGWGNYKDGSSWSYGAGPNLLFKFGQTRLDVAAHYRHYPDGEKKPELFLRTQVFL